LVGASEIPRGSVVVSERRAFGERARRQRERRGVTLEAIAQSTKVPASLFAGLERGDCARWPAGLYSRAYVRAYAELIGLDPNEAVEDFTAAFGETVWPDGAPTPRRAPAAGDLRLAMDDQPEVRQQRAFRRVTVGIADLALAGALVWLTHAYFEASLWMTVGVALAYTGGGRLFIDEPIVGWLLRALVGTPAAAPEEVPVRDVSDAATTA
jgi:transcriptional regulator with XRE-family HTH domain